MPIFETEVPATVAVEVEFEVYCDACGAGLCNQSTTGRTRNRQELMVRVMPCEKCLDATKDAARDAGYEEARAKYEES